MTNVIYQPKGQAGEYGEWASNPYRGCGHKCAYCYVPAVLHMSRAEFDMPGTLRPGYLKNFERDAARLQEQGKSVNIFFCFTTDLYHPGDISATRKVLELTQKYGHSFTVLTKGGDLALRDIDLYRPGLDMFASTLTSCDSGFSDKWERGASSPWERIQTLATFHKLDIFTWVSLEPVLDAGRTLEVIQATSRYVDFYKVGKANYIKLPAPIDWMEFTTRVTELLNRLGKRHYVKKDLQKYLPEGYENTRLEDLEQR